MALVGLAPDVYVALAFLAVAGGADECSAVFRDTMWKQSIPDHLRGRMAGIELLCYAAGPPAGQLRSGAVAALTSVRFSLTSGGVACVAAVAAVRRPAPRPPALHRARSRARRAARRLARPLRPQTPGCSAEAVAECPFRYGML